MVCPPFLVRFVDGWWARRAERAFAHFTDSRQRRNAFDLDQHFRIGQRRHHAGGAGRIGRRPERFRIELVHRGDVGCARQQHVDLDQIAKARTGFIEHALDVGDDVGELRLEAIGKAAVLVKAGDAGDEQEIADAGGKGERRGFDAGRGREVLDGHGGPSSGISMAKFYRMNLLLNFVERVASVS